MLVMTFEGNLFCSDGCLSPPYVLYSGNTSICGYSIPTTGNSGSAVGHLQLPPLPSQVHAQTLPGGGSGTRASPSSNGQQLYISLNGPSGGLGQTLHHHLRPSPSSALSPTSNTSNSLLLFHPSNSAQCGAMSDHQRSCQ